jgi:DNA-directed RNA polymerase specialized sigma subunit
LSSILGEGRKYLRAWGTYEKRRESIERHIDELRQLQTRRPEEKDVFEREIARHREYLASVAEMSELVQGSLLRGFTDREIELLKRRYIQGQTWAQIGRWLSIDESYARRIERRVAYQISAIINGALDDGGGPAPR